MEGAGHSVHRDKPEATIEALLRFTETLTAA
jgi:pimeloyl-ACP methyl ester carboxylesterase